MADQALTWKSRAAGEEEVEDSASPQHLQVPLAQAMAVQKLDAKANHEKGLTIYAPLRDDGLSCCTAGVSGSKIAGYPGAELPMVVGRGP